MYLFQKILTKSYRIDILVFKKFCQIKAINFPSLKTRQIEVGKTANENLSLKWDKY